MKKGDRFPIAGCYKRKPAEMIEATGEKRPPKIGEWFLSGAIVEGYISSHNMAVAYQIGKLVVSVNYEII